MIHDLARFHHVISTSDRTQTKSMRSRLFSGILLPYENVSACRGARMVRPLSNVAPNYCHIKLNIRSRIASLLLNPITTRSHNLFPQPHPNAIAFGTREAYRTIFKSHNFTGEDIGLGCYNLQVHRLLQLIPNLAHSLQ